MSKWGFLTKNVNLAITSIWNYLQDNQLHKLNRNKINMQDAKKYFYVYEKNYFYMSNKIKIKSIIFWSFLCFKGKH